MKRAETGQNPGKQPGQLSEPDIHMDEERYRLAVEAAELGSWDYFPLTGKIILNEKCRTLLGMHGNGSITYNDFLDHIHHNDGEHVDRTLRKAILPTPQNNFSCEFRSIVQKEHRPQWIRLTGKAYFNKKAQVCRIVGVLLDINEKKAIDRTGSLQKLTADLERSNQNLEEFAFMASHDLQEPLRKIRIFTELMQDKLAPQLSDADKVYLEKINSAAIRMGALIRSLLDYSRLSGKGVQFITTDMNEIIKTVVSDLEISISRKNAVVDVGPLPVIDAVPIQIVQLFTNLISNALKFACDNIPPMIRIASREMDQKELDDFPALHARSTYTEITVADNGIGFDPAFAEQIFGIFQRLHGQHQYEGTGIGLSICRKIVNNHNGLIFAKSKKEAGATFHVILPVKQAV